jgi:hypothetical protein
MEKNRSSARECLRIIWAIATKDITDAIKDKAVLTVVLGMAMLMLSAQAFPFLLKLSATPRAICTTPGTQLAAPRASSRLWRRTGPTD